MLTRRTMLGTALAGLTASRLQAAAAPLRSLAAARGKLFGCSAGSYQLKAADFAAVLAREVNVLVPEYELKRLTVEPEPGRFDFAGVDALAGFAEAHGMKMRGHTLVWYAANPPWLEAKVLNAPDDEILTYYVAHCMARYRGRIQSWDVVNEVLWPEDGRADNLRDCHWLKRFGPGYIDLAFHTAKAADPAAQLVYNDWGCEGGEAKNDRFRTATLKFLEGLRRRKVPVDALGLQGHLNATGPQVDQKKLRVFLDEVQAMGFRILVTELDVDETEAPLDIPARDQAVADATARFLDVVLDNRAVDAVLCWGLSDRYAWKPEWFHPRPGYVSRKAPFDADLKPKPMAEAIARAFGG